MSREILPFQFETHAMRVVRDESGEPWDIPGTQAKTARIRGVVAKADFVPLDALPMPLDMGRAV